MRPDEHVRQIGVMSTAELLARGIEVEWIKIAVLYGKVIRVRKGWYAHPGENGDVIRAWRVGGRLTCISALAFHGLATQPDELHVEVAGNAARLRSPHDQRRRLSADDKVIVHWNRSPGSGDKRSVTPEAARQAAERCAAAQAATPDRGA